MRFKKLIPLFLGSALAVGTLSGCSSDELAYVNMLKEMSDIKTFEMSTDLTLNVPEDISVSLKGDVDISDMKSPYANLDISLTVPDAEIELQNGKLIYQDNTLYVSPELVLTFLSMDESDTFVDLAKTNVNNTNYYSTVVDNPFVEFDPTMIFSDKTIDDIVNVFSDFSTSVVSKKDNNYTISLNKDTVLEVADDIAEYFQYNSQAVVEGLWNAIKNNEQLLTFAEIDKTTFTDPMVTDIAKSEISSIITDFATNYKAEYRPMLESALAEIKTLDLLSTINKEQDLYTYYYALMIEPEVHFHDGLDFNNFEPELSDNGLSEPMITPLSITAITYIHPIEVVKHDFSNEKIVDMDTFKQNVSVLYREKVPVKEITLYCYDENDGAFATYELSDGSYDTDEYVFTNREDRIYLPLRKIAETFNETVVWNQAEEKAYVVRGNEYIDMTGFVEDDTTFVKIRDFEKLGYTLDYDYGVVTITK